MISKRRTKRTKEYGHNKSNIKNGIQTFIIKKKK